MPFAEIIMAAIRLLVLLAGSHEAARNFITADEERAANEAADAIARGRTIADNMFPR